MEAMSVEGRTRRLVNLRFRASKSEAVRQVSSKCFPELLLLVLWDNIQLIVVLLIFLVMSIDIGFVRSLALSTVGAPAASATAATATTTLYGIRT